MLGKFNFLCSFHIWVSFLKIYGFNDYNKFQFLECEQLTCLCIIYPAFVVIEKLSCEYLGNKVLKLHWILNVIRVIDISGWLSSLQFLSVTLLVMEIKPRLFYQVVKSLGRLRPLTWHFHQCSDSQAYEDLSVYNMFEWLNASLAFWHT